MSAEKWCVLGQHQEDQQPSVLVEVQAQVDLVAVGAQVELEEQQLGLAGPVQLVVEPKVVAGQLGLRPHLVPELEVLVVEQLEVVGHSVPVRLAQAAVGPLEQLGVGQQVALELAVLVVAPEAAEQQLALELALLVVALEVQAGRFAYEDPSKLAWLVSCASLGAKCNMRYLFCELCGNVDHHCVSRHISCWDRYQQGARAGEDR